MSTITAQQVILGKDWSRQRMLMNCVVPTGQILFEVEQDIGSDTWITVQTITSTQSFFYNWPMEQVNLRVTPSGGATLIVPAL